ncbi:MAG: hypothetical protein COB41_08945 [Proteobacteria bacterium]|nr:MAG: hypothetical protein COB41_08945 [Pseudomonadota bacterium]
MAGLDDKYARDIHKELDHYAGILPCEHDFQLGDYGIMRGKKFEVMGNITQDFGIKVESKNTAASASFEYQSEKGVTFKHDGNATALAGNLKAGATIEFNRKNSFLVKAEEMSSKAINNYHYCPTKYCSKLKKV